MMVSSLMYLHAYMNPGTDDIKQPLISERGNDMVAAGFARVHFCKSCGSGDAGDIIRSSARFAMGKNPG
jgi:hypothetical protein